MTKQTTAKTAAPKPKKRRIVSLDRKKARAGWFFIMPFILGFVIIYIPIIFDSIKFSFNEIKILQGGGYTLNFVGWANYQEALFVDPDFIRTVTTGVQQLLFDIPAIVIFSLFMAVLLNQNMFGRAAFRAIFFIPVILSTGLIDQIDRSNELLNYMNDMSQTIDDGTGGSAVTDLIKATDLSFLFSNMRVGNDLAVYVSGLINNIYDIINRSGVQMLIFLAGLQSISPSIYESCSIDGASAWETFWKITLPMISPMILVNTVYTIIDSFTSESNTVMNYINAVYNEAGGTVVSSAMAWMYFLLVIGIIALAAALLSAFVFYQRRDA
ncbi:MAG: sugar ABC transporter permease [Firmicutes bacterium]|nr:sugar ABC transporter permease [Bacillota bacterium]